MLAWILFGEETIICVSSAYSVFIDVAKITFILEIHTRGVVSESEGWVSAVWSCRSGLSGSGGSRCRSWQRNELTAVC